MQAADAGARQRQRKPLRQRQRRWQRQRGGSTRLTPIVQQGLL
jgi:hypothetical protein